MRATIALLIIVAAFVLFVQGCGPGQPFEIESRNAPGPTSTVVAAAQP